MRAGTCLDSLPCGAWALRHFTLMSRKASIRLGGVGGGLAALQVRNQEWTGDNLGLRRNAETGTPVRVFRGTRTEDNETRYTYEGLYAVRAGRRVVSCRPAGCQAHLDGVCVCVCPVSHCKCLTVRQPCVAAFWYLT